MTSPSETKRKVGRPLGSKTKPKIGRPLGSKTKPKPKVTINVEAMLANSELKKAREQVANLEVKLASTLDHIGTVEKQHKAALVVIGYLERKLFAS